MDYRPPDRPLLNDGHDRRYALLISQSAYALAVLRARQHGAGSGYHAVCEPLLGTCSPYTAEAPPHRAQGQCFNSLAQANGMD
jgi:hypothetical protein